jgi:spermidine/putrescine transport system ATP-binding protein
LSTRIAVMNRGRVEQLDEPDKLYGAPKTRFVADFIGHINLLDVEVVEAAHGQLRVRDARIGDISVRGTATPGQRGSFALRPEQIRLVAQADAHELKNHFPGRVQEYLYLGDVTVYRIALDNGATLEALAANAEPGRPHFYEIGDAVTACWRQDAGLFLPEKS